MKSRGKKRYETILQKMLHWLYFLMHLQFKMRKLQVFSQIVDAKKFAYTKWNDGANINK